MKGDLVYRGGVGIQPDPGSTEEVLLHACAAENKALWDELCKVPHRELENAVHRLRCLGWGFEWIVYH